MPMHTFVKNIITSDKGKQWYKLSSKKPTRSDSKKVKMERAVDL